MAAASTVRIEGYRETMRALKSMEGKVDLAVKAALRKAADPIAASARERVAAFQGASAGTIGPRAVLSGVFVTQRARKTTGLRGDFGALQMREALLPALAEHEDSTVEEVEDTFNALARLHGF